MHIKADFRIKMVLGNQPQVSLTTVRIHAASPDCFTFFHLSGRIPAIVDPNRNNVPVFETAAILHYLVIHYDPEGKFHFRGQ
jgi:glutathione S-transferase